MAEAIEARLKRLEARESIRDCIHRYALAGDRKNDGAILQHLFTADAVYELVGMGRFEGRDEIVQGLAEIARSVVLWSFHLPGGPLITLDKDCHTAKVFWWVWAPGRIQEADGSSKSYWGGIQYNGDMVEEDGAWKFRFLLLETRMRTPFEGPWTEVPGPFHWPE